MRWRPRNDRAWPSYINAYGGIDEVGDIFRVGFLPQGIRYLADHSIFPQALEPGYRLDRRDAGL